MKKSVEKMVDFARNTVLEGARSRFLGDLPEMKKLDYLLTQEEIFDWLRETKTIAIVGLSPKRMH